MSLACRIYRDRPLSLRRPLRRPCLTSGIPERGWLAGTRMGLFVRALTRRNLIAIAAGVLLAGAPLVAFDFWLTGMIDRQGGAEIANAARRAVSLAETRLNLAISGLDELAAQGVDSCGPSQLQACLLYTSPSPRDRQKSRMPSSA